MLARLKALWWRRIYAFDLVLLGWAIALALALNALGLLTNSELRTYDGRLRIAEWVRPETQSAGVVLLPIDDLAIERYGRWPWARSRWGPILDALADLRMKSVFFDIEFADPSEPTLRRDPAGRTYAQMLDDGVAPLTDFFAPQRLAQMLSSDAARRDLPEALRTLGRLTQGRLHGLEDELRRAVSDPDDDLARAVVRCGRRGMPVLGVFFIAGGTTTREARETAQIDRYVHALVAEGGRGGGEVPALAGWPAIDARALAREGPTLAVESLLVRHPLADADALAAMGTGLPRSRIEDVLATARETVLGAALDVALDRDPDRPESELLSDLGHRLNAGDGIALRDPVSRLLDVARARALLRRRFSIPTQNRVRRAMAPFRSFVPPILPLVRTYSGLAVSTVPADVDGVYRRMPLLWPVEGGMMPSPTLMIFLHELGEDPARPAAIATHLESGPDSTLRVSVPGHASFSIPLDDTGAMLCRYQGTYAAGLPKVPLSAVMGYLSLKDEWTDYFERRAYPAGEYRRARIFHRIARDLATRGDPSLDFAGLATAVKGAGLWEQSMGEGDVASTGSAPTTTGALRASIWEWRAQDRLQSLERDHVNRIELSVRRFHEKPPEEQKAKLSRPGSLWPAWLDAARMFDLRERDRLKERLTRLLAGRTGIIGAAHTANTDFGPTPLEEKAPNFALHAHAVATLESRRFIRRPGWRVATLAPTALSCLAIGLVLPAVGILVGLAWTMATILLHGVIATALLVEGGTWIDVVGPVIGMSATYLFVSTYRYFKEERRKQEIRQMLEAYVDARAVQRFLDHQELWRELGGTTCEITAFFSDIEGFTGISEILQADELSRMLTDYLSPMTDILLAHEGVRDKYIGDAIVAFFGAPLHIPDHAAKACLASIEQMARLKAIVEDPRLLNDPSSWLSRLKAKGKSLRIRIGLNTGLAKVGNFGSLRNRNYTMIGDTVNLASRLEGANKAFGTSVMISEFTYAKAKDSIEARALDRLVVKGKLIPVTVYEVLGARGTTPDVLLTVRDTFDAGRALYLEQRFDEARDIFRRGLALRPDDGPCHTYIERCDELALHPPAPDWDGVYHLKEK